MNDVVGSFDLQGEIDDGDLAIDVIVVVRCKDSASGASYLASFFSQGSDTYVRRGMLEVASDMERDGAEFNDLNAGDDLEDE